MIDVVGIFLMLLSFKFLFARDSQIVNSLMNTLVPIPAQSQSQISFDSTLP